MRFSFPMNPAGEQRLGFFQFRPAGGTQTASAAVDEVSQHAEPEAGPFGETFFEARLRAMVAALLVKSPGGGKVETVFTLATQRFFPAGFDFAFDLFLAVIAILSVVVFLLALVSL